MFKMRLRLMGLLGFSTDGLATEVRNRAIREREEAQAERLGPQPEAIRRIHAKVRDTHARAADIAG